MRESSNKKVPAKPAMAETTTKFDPMAHETDSWTLPAYLSEVANVGDNNAKVDVFDPRKPVTYTKAFLPIMEVNLPMDPAGNEIETDCGYIIYSHGKLPPYTDDITLAEIKRRMVTVELSVRVHRWNYGWPEHMTADKYPGADLEAPARSNPSALKAP